MLVDLIVAGYRWIRGLGFQFQKLPGTFDSMKYAFFLIYVVILGVRHGLQQVVHSELNAYITQDDVFHDLLLSTCGVKLRATKFSVSVLCTA